MAQVGAEAQQERLVAVEGGRPARAGGADDVVVDADRHDARRRGIDERVRERVGAGVLGEEHDVVGRGERVAGDAAVALPLLHAVVVGGDPVGDEVLVRDDDPAPERQQQREVRRREDLARAVHDVGRRLRLVRRALVRQQREILDRLERGLDVGVEVGRRDDPQRDAARAAERRDELDRVDLRSRARRAERPGVDRHRQLVEPARGDEQRVLDRRLGSRVELACRGAVRVALVERRLFGVCRRGRLARRQHVVGEHVAEAERGAALGEVGELGRGEAVVADAGRVELRRGGGGLVADAGRVERAAADEHAAGEGRRDPRAQSPGVLGDLRRRVIEVVVVRQRGGRKRAVREHGARRRDGRVAVDSRGEALEPVAERLHARQHDREIGAPGRAGRRFQRARGIVARLPDDDRWFARHRP